MQREISPLSITTLCLNLFIFVQRRSSPWTNTTIETGFFLFFLTIWLRFDRCRGDMAHLRRTDFRAGPNE